MLFLYLSKPATSMTNNERDLYILMLIGLFSSVAWNSAEREAWVHNPTVHAYALKFFARKWSRGNVWKVARKRKSGMSLNFYVTRDLLYIASILFMHVKVTRQWKSTLNFFLRYAFQERNAWPCFVVTNYVAWLRNIVFFLWLTQSGVKSKFFVELNWKYHGWEQFRRK